MTPSFGQEIIPIPFAVTVSLLVLKRSPILTGRKVKLQIFGTRSFLHLDLSIDGEVHC
jgi:hypothetical protein